MDRKAEKIKEFQDSSCEFKVNNSKLEARNSKLTDSSLEPFGERMELKEGNYTRRAEAVGRLREIPDYAQDRQKPHEEISEVKRDTNLSSPLGNGLELDRIEKELEPLHHQLKEKGIDLEKMPEKTLEKGKYDPSKVDRELERRIREGEEVWENNGEARADFARQFGINTHQYLEEKIRQSEKAAGRKEGPETFEIEKTIKCPDGTEVRLDYWDHEAKAIDDIKPIEDGETIGELIDKHGDQLKRYIEVVDKCAGEEVKWVGIRPYPGVKE